MNDEELTQLRDRYRNVAAPPELAARIRDAAANENTRPRRGWLLPLTGGLVAASALIVGLPLLMDDEKATIPSMAELASALPDKPALTVPSVGSLKLPARPALPTRPDTSSPVVDPESNEDTGANVPAPRSLKEKNV